MSAATQEAGTKPKGPFRRFLRKLGIGVFWTNLLLKVGVVVALGLAWLNAPRDTDRWRLAENLPEYFNHLSTRVSSSSAGRIAVTQVLLRSCGYDIGAAGADGTLNAATSKAISTFQADNGLPVLGACDNRTFDALVKVALADPITAEKLNAIILDPCRRDDMRRLMDDLPRIYSATYGSTIFIRPDVEVMSLYCAHDIKDMKVKYEAQADRVFGEQSGGHIHDSFRHAAAVFWLSRYVGTKWAVRMGDLREKVEPNDFPESLKDHYNNRRAAQLYRDSGKPSDEKTAETLIAQAIRSGDLLTLPVPLVPKN